MLLLVAAAQLAFSFMNVVIELLDRNTPVPITTIQIVAVRMAITYAGSTSWMLWRKIPNPFIGPPEVRRLLVARGVAGFFGLFAVYYSLGYMTLSDSTTLTFLTPALTGLFAHLFLGETFTERELLAALASLVGVIFITWPSFLFGVGENDISGERVLAWEIKETHVALGVSLLGVTGAAAAYTIISAIGRRAHAVHMVAYLSGASLIATISGMIFFRIPFVFPSTFRSFVYLISAGVLGCIGQTLLSIGLQGEKAGRGSLVMFLQIIFSGLVDRLTFVHPDRLPFFSFLGSVIILLAAYFGTFHNLTHPSSNSSPTSHSPLHPQHDLPLHSPKVDRRTHLNPNQTHAFSFPPNFLSTANTKTRPLSSYVGSQAQSIAGKLAQTLGLSPGGGTGREREKEKIRLGPNGSGNGSSSRPLTGGSSYSGGGGGGGKSLLGLAEEKKDGGATFGVSSSSSLKGGPKPLSLEKEEDQEWETTRAGSSGGSLGLASGRKSPRSFAVGGVPGGMGMEKIS